MSEFEQLKSCMAIIDNYMAHYFGVGNPCKFSFERGRGLVNGMQGEYELLISKTQDMMVVNITGMTLEELILKIKTFLGRKLLKFEEREKNSLEALNELRKILNDKNLSSS